MSVLSVSRPPDKEAALDTFNLFLIIIVVIIMIVVTVTIALSAFCQESTGMALIHWAHSQAAMKTRKERNSKRCNDPLISNYFYLKVSEAETLRPKPRCYKLSRKSALFWSLKGVWQHPSLFITLHQVIFLSLEPTQLHKYYILYSKQSHPPSPLQFHN